MIPVQGERWRQDSVRSLARAYDNLVVSEQKPSHNDDTRNPQCPCDYITHLNNTSASS